MALARLDITIRLAQPGDEEALAALSGQLGYPSTPEQVRARWEALAQDGGGAVYVAEMTGTVIGWAHVQIYPQLVVDRSAELGGLVVDERYQGRAVGTRLMEAVERWAYSRGCKSMGVHSNVIRERAHRFYEQLGYERVKNQVVFRKRLSG